MVVWEADILVPDILKKYYPCAKQDHCSSLWLIRISSVHAYLSVIGQCTTWPSLQFPGRQEVNVTIFIIFYRILSRFCRYLVHIISNQHPCKDILTLNNDALAMSLKGEWSMNCLTFGLDLVNFGTSWCVKMTRDGVNIALHCILMIDIHISMRAIPFSESYS